MSSITEQFSAATKSQLEAQLSLLNSLASQAVQSAEKVIALNLSTTKASVEKTTATTRQLLEAKDPREFFSVSAQAPNFDNVLAYSRQLFSIASAVQKELMQNAKASLQQATATKPAAAPQLAAPKTQPAAEAKKPAEPVAAATSAPAAPATAPAVAAPVAAPIVTTTPAASAAAAAAETVADPIVTPAAAPKAAAKAAAKAKPATEQKPLAEAATQLSDKPAAASATKPVASFPSTKPVALKSVAASSAAPVKTSTGPVAKPAPSKQLDMLGGGKTKK